MNGLLNEDDLKAWFKLSPNAHRSTVIAELEKIGCEYAESKSTKTIITTIHQINQAIGGNNASAEIRFAANLA